MLETMRRMAGTLVVRILFGILIISFAGWGVGDMLRSHGVSDNVAEVGSVSISRDELARQYRREIERFQRVMGPEFDSARAREMGLLQRTLDTMIDGQLLGQKAHDMGLVVSEPMVRSRIFAEPAFQGPGHQFDAAIFRQMLAQAGMPEALYVATLSGAMLRDQLTDAISSGAEAPALLRDTIYRYRGERRVAEYIRIPNATVGQVPEPTQDDLAAFHTKNPALFTLPEMRELTIIVLDPDDVAGGFKPSEADIKDAYQQRLPSLSIPERRLVRHMLFADEAGAKKAEEMLSQGKSFDDVAKSAPGQLAQDVSLGLVTRSDLPPSLADTAFKLEEGKPSTPLKDPLGWHILVVDKIEPGHTPPLDSVRGDIVHELAHDAAVDSLVKTANKLEDELAGGASLEQAAQKLGLKAFTAGPIDSKGRLRNGAPAPDLPSDPKFLEFAFRTPEGEATHLEESRNGGYFIVRVDKVNPPALRPLDEVRDKVVAAWKAHQRDEKARARAEKLLERAKSGDSLSKLAGEVGAQAKTSKPFSRFTNDSNPEVPAPLVAALFKAHQDEAVMAPYDGGYAIGRLKEVKPATTSAAAADAAALQRELRLAMARDLVAEYTRALRRVYEVDINRDAVDSIQ